MIRYSLFATINDLNDRINDRIFFRYTYPRLNIAAIVDGFSIDETKNKEKIMISIDLPSKDSQEQLKNHLGAILPPSLIWEGAFGPDIRIDIKKSNNELVIKVLLIINQLAPFDKELIQNLEKILTLNGALHRALHRPIDQEYVFINKTIGLSSIGSHIPHPFL